MVARIPARLAVALGVLALAMIGLAAFRPATHASPTTLRVWYATDDPTERSWSQSLAQRFQASHPNVTVQLTDYALDDMNTKLQLALGAGNPPDLIYTTPRGPGIPTYVHAHLLRDLSSLASSRHWSDRLRPGLLAEYNSLLSADPKDSGRVYAVPYHLAAVAVLYNKTLFRKLGLSIPRTVDEMETLAVRVRKAGYTPFGLGNADGWLGDDWWSALVNAYAGPAALSPLLRLKPSFTYQGAAFRWGGDTLQRWANAGYFTEDFGGLDAQDGINDFFGGHTALQLISSTENSQILAAVGHTKLDIGIFPFPSVSSKRPPVMPMSGYEGWAVPRDARQPQLAMQFIDQVALSAQTAALLLDHGMLPVYRIDSKTMRPAAPFQRDFFDALATAAPGVYLDGAPVPNLNATMEANIQLLLQGAESPDFLTRSLQEVYTSRGAKATHTRTDGEF